VPAKIANFLIAQVYGKSFPMDFESSSKIANDLKLALNNEEFSKLNTMVQHWWARQFDFKVYRRQVENREFVSSLLNAETLDLTDFQDIVKIAPTTSAHVFEFSVVDFEYEFIEEEEVDEESNRAGNISPKLERDNEEELVEAPGTMLNRRQPNEPRSNSRNRLAEESDEDEEDEEEEVPSQGSDKKNIVKVLKGTLKPEEFGQLVDSEDLFETLKKGFSFIGDDDIPVEITYTQVVNHNSDCFKAIEAARAK